MNKFYVHSLDTAVFSTAINQLQLNGFPQTVNQVKPHVIIDNNNNKRINNNKQYGSAQTTCSLVLTKMAA